MSEHSAVPANSAETTRDLQNRLGRFARTLAVISGLMLVASLLSSLLVGPGGSPISVPSRSVHVFAVALALSVWGLMRGKDLTLRALHALDAALVVTVCT